MRHRVRSIYQSVYDHLVDQLTALDWTTPGGAKKNVVKFQSYVPDETGKGLEYNTVAITLGDEAPEMEAELGDGLVSMELQIYVDVYGENQTITLAIADDVKDILRGRINGLSRYIPAYDYTAYTGDPASRLPVSDVIEMTNVGRQPARVVELRRNWQIVYGVALVEFAPDPHHLVP